jgi:hypothetical protein
MNILITLLFVTMLSFSVVACAKEEPTKENTSVTKEEVKPSEPVYKTVCLDVQGRDGKPVIDPKTGKPKQNCTKVRVRQKFEGTKVPEPTKK